MDERSLWAAYIPANNSKTQLVLDGPLSELRGLLLGSPELQEGRLDIFDFPDVDRVRQTGILVVLEEEKDALGNLCAVTEARLEESSVAWSALAKSIFALSCIRCNLRHLHLDLVCAN